MVIIQKIKVIRGYHLCLKMILINVNKKQYRIQNVCNHIFQQFEMHIVQLNE